MTERLGDAELSNAAFISEAELDDPHLLDFLQ
jgi:hypothetical protein